MKKKLKIIACLVLAITSAVHSQPREPKWETLANMPIPRFGHSAVLHQGKVWIIGGKSQINNTLNTVDCFDLEKMDWQTDSATLGQARFDAAAVVYQDKIFVIGGRNDRQIFNSVEYFDPVEQQWKDFAPLAYPRWGASAVVYNDTLFVINGISNKSIIPTPVDSIEFWDETASTWKRSKAWQLFQARGFAQSVVIDSFVYTLGGAWFDNNLDIMERFDRLGGTILLKPLRKPRVSFSAVPIKQLIYVIGGLGLGTPDGLHRTIDYYSTKWNVWDSLTIEISQPRASLAAVSDDTSIFIFGGIDENLHALNSAERLTGIPTEYNPATSVGIREKNISQPREHQLINNYPNPFNAITTISVQMVSEARSLELDIFNIRGERIRTFQLNSLLPGLHRVEWDGRDENGRSLESGIYFAQLRSDQFIGGVLKLSLIK